MPIQAMLKRSPLVPTAPTEFSPLYLLPSTHHSRVTADSAQVTSQPERTPTYSSEELFNGPSLSTDLTEAERTTLRNETWGEKLLESMKSFVREEVPLLLAMSAGIPSLGVCCFLAASGMSVACIPLPLLVAVVSTILCGAAILLDPLKMLAPSESELLRQQHRLIHSLRYVETCFKGEQQLLDQNVTKERECLEQKIKQKQDQLNYRFFHLKNNRYDALDKVKLQLKEIQQPASVVEGELIA